MKTTEPMISNVLVTAVTSTPSAETEVKLKEAHRLSTNQPIWLIQPILT